MQRRAFLAVGLSGAATLGLQACATASNSFSEPGQGDALNCDTFVYGSTPGGIAAAVEAARRGDRVVLACPKRNPGAWPRAGFAQRTPFAAIFLAGSCWSLSQAFASDISKSQAKANVSYRVGREGRDEFGESKAGIHYLNWRTGKQIMTPDTGEPSVAIQAFCTRSIFTNDPRHLIPIEQPASYEEHLPDLLPLREDFRGGRITRWGRGTELPRSKYQMNGSITGLTSTNCPGVNWGYPEADRHHRQRLDDFHRDHVTSLIWFLQHDTAVPDSVRSYMQGLGLHDEEFADNGHWPWQLYVRQGRRIEGRALITQHSFTPDPTTGRTPTVEVAIAMGEHSFDVHPCHDRRFLVEGYVEGVLWYPKKADGPAQPGQISYGAMLPKSLDNLLVPVALSSTHVAMSVLRMEPVWMTTGQVAGLAAVRARELSCDVASLDPAPLPKLLHLPTTHEV